MVMRLTSGVDFALPVGPPLRQPPLSLLDLAPTLVDADTAQSAEREAQEAALAAGDDLAAARAFSEASAARAEAERWELGFQYPPELGLGATELFQYGQPTGKAQGDNAPAVCWYDPFEVVARDQRGTFGATSWEDRTARARRALLAHEPWQAEREFWTGGKIPTNFHLAANPATATTGLRRTIDAWPDPTPAAGTVLGQVVGLKRSLAALDQSIADSDAGVGMIHATPYLVQLWSSVYPFLRDSQGRLLTVNLNLIVPGFGYTGTGPMDQVVTLADGATHSNTSVTSATASFTDDMIGASISGGSIPAGATVVDAVDAHTLTISAAAGTTATGVTLTIGATIQTGAGEQWAYATDTVYKLRGPVNVYPSNFAQQGTAMLNLNDAAVRAERPWALVTNRLLRAAVLVDTTTA